MSDIFDETELQNNKILKNLSDSTLESLTDDVEKLTFSDIYEEADVAGNNVLEYLYNATDDQGNLYPITNLTDAVDKMAVSDVFDQTEINDNPILKSLAYHDNGDKVLVNEMNDRLNLLTVEDVFGDDMYKKNDQGEYVDKDGNVELINVGVKNPTDPIETLSDLLDRSPEIIAKIKSLFSKAPAEETEEDWSGSFGKHIIPT